MIIYLLAALPFTFVPLSEKISAANEVVNDVGYIQYFKATFLSDIFSVPAIYLSRPVLILAYTIWAIVLWIRYTADKKLSSVFSSQHFMKVWISVLLGTLLILLISHILLIIRVFELNFSELALALGVLRILSVAGLIGLLISPFFFPSIIYGLPQVPELTGTSHKIAKKTNGNSGDLTKTNTHLEADYLNSIGQKAESYMIENQPYLQPHFNINKLAVEINVPMHHLGYYLRQIKKQSFTEYRNTWRIEHAKKLMMEGKQNDLTLEAIASLSGFSNRNSFRATFQKIEGIPPSAFASSV
jgi:AraC-like DNA-binding protein